MHFAGYTLSRLRDDGEFVLYRARTGDAELPSVLLRRPASARPGPETLKKIDDEYALRSELQSAWAVRPVALSQEDGQVTLILEDPGGQMLDGSISRGMETAEFLRCAMRLAKALGGLHDRGLIHKDVKPGNILVDFTTHQAWLTGFGLCSRVRRLHQEPEAHEFIAGSLPYMAPEQTGRMNRSVDSRSDLYSLGVTFYQMLTGALPFAASDPIEWVHCHVARSPLPPHQRVENVPSPVSAIVMKLLAKVPEERYQTASGLESDLHRCRVEWDAHGQITEFALGQNDVPDRLLIPEKIYGREREVQVLLDAFGRVLSEGRPELVLVSGYSGIGKTAVVNEVHKSLFPSRGLFASGKFDQHKRDIPYAALAQAFRGLTRVLLGKSEEELSRWRTTLQRAVDSEGQLIVGLVPELKTIIGEQSPVPQLSQQEATRRFHLVIGRFIAVFAKPEHPLVLFLDDLQWLDSPTLDVLEYLLTQAGISHLLLIGAYRSNEVDPDHPLCHKLTAMRDAGASLENIALAPLTGEDLKQLTADALRCEKSQVPALAELVHEKTAGNPFFAIQFLYALFDEDLLTFNRLEARWSWDLDRIQAKGYTDNVVDLMVRLLTRLDPETQDALKHLACLGNSADSVSMHAIYHDSIQRTHAQLAAAVEAGFILRANDSYRFIHDRVQEAAYSLIPQESRAEMHLRIGMLMASRFSPETLEERVFEIVNQLNRGSDLIPSIAERQHIAELNLIAARRAKASAAYFSAISYLQTARQLLADETWKRSYEKTLSKEALFSEDELLTSDAGLAEHTLTVLAGRADDYLEAARRLLSDESWNQSYELVFAIECLLAECELLTADMASAQNRLEALARRGKDAHDRALVTRLRLTLYTALDRSDRAIQVFLEYWKGLGTDWSSHPSDQEVLQEYEQVWHLLGNRQIDELKDLPLITDPDVLDVLDVFTGVVSPALLSDQRFLGLVICRMVRLSLEHGNSDASCYAYVWFGMLAGSQFGNHQAGFRFGKLGCELVEERGLRRYQARTYLPFGTLVIPWTRHIKEGREFQHRCFDVANKSGDLTYAAFSCFVLYTNLLASGDPLAEVQREAETGLEFATKIRFGLAIDCITAQLGLIRNLRGLTANFGTLNDESFSEARFESHLAANPSLALSACWYWIRKMQARFFAGEYEAAVEASLQAEPLLSKSPSFFEVAEYHFYSALSRAADLDSTNKSQQQKDFERLLGCQEQHRIWAQNCPENFENRAALIDAEIARIEGHVLEAEQFYERAIASARSYGFLNNEAIAYELAARFYASRGFQKFANAYMQEASYCYQRWGAEGKVARLNQLHAYHHSERSASKSITESAAELLDLATVIGVSQAVSGEMVPEKLIDSLMRAAVQQAGADHGLLVRPEGDQFQIQAEAISSGAEVIVRQGDFPGDATILPQSVVRYVMRAKESVLLDDASSPNPFSADPYLVQSRPRSILTLPLISHGKLISVLHLENSLTPHVFTAERITVLKVLASQAGISLENTWLYRDLENRERRIRRLIDANVIGIVIWDLDGRVIDANDAFLRMVQYDRKDLESGLRWFDITPPEWQEVHSRVEAEELQATGKMQPREKEYFRKDGTRVPVMIGAACFEDQPDQGVAYIVDLSAQKRAEEALRRSENYLAQAQQLAHIGSWAWEIPTLKGLYASEEWYRIYGLEPGEGIPDFEQRVLHIHPEDRARYRTATFRAIAEKSAYDVEFRIFSSHGGFKYIHSVGHPVFDSSGELLQFVGVAMDVTGQKRAEDALRTSEAYLMDAQRLTQTGSCAINGTSREILYWSDEMFRLFGFDPKQGLPVWDDWIRRIHPDDLETFRMAGDNTFLKKVDCDVVFRIVKPDGAVRHIHGIGHPVLSAGGELVQVVGTMVDITERRRAEEAANRVRQLQDDLAHISRVSTMGELTASLAHEIKQPIGAAVTNAEACLRLINRPEPDLSEAREAALEMVKDARRAGEIIERVRSLYRKDSSRQAVIEVNEVIGEMVLMLQNEASRHSITMRTNLTEQLSSVMADRVQLQQALMNLMLNALEAMRGTGGELTIASAAHDGSQVMISVSDTGVGLPTADADQIFDAFFTTKSHGTGLGLAITRSIIEAHGGRIWFSTNSGPGATFHFTLPATESAAA
jgi:PAS domain S-box-containing protein